MSYTSFILVHFKEIVVFVYISHFENKIYKWLFVRMSETNAKIYTVLGIWILYRDQNKRSLAFLQVFNKYKLVKYSYRNWRNVLINQAFISKQTLRRGGGVRGKKVNNNGWTIDKSYNLAQYTAWSRGSVLWNKLIFLTCHEHMTTAAVAQSVRPFASMRKVRCSNPTDLSRENR